MASGLTVNDSKRLNIECERLAVSLAITIEEGDADKFGDIYDTSIPTVFGQKKVESIKERVRELLEHPEELETLKADFQAADNLMSKLSQTFLGNDFNRSLCSSSDRLKSEDINCYRPSDVNHNLFSVSGSVSMEGREELMSKRNDSSNKKDTYSVDPKAGNPTDKVKTVSQKKEDAFRDNLQTVMSVRSTIEVQCKQKPEEVDDKIQFGNKLQTVKHNSVSPAKVKRDILSSKKNAKSTHQTDGVNALGPHSPHKLLGNAVNLIGKPSEADVKNCPDPEPIHQNHRADVHLTESTPILGHSKSERGMKIPQKRQGEQQREREVEDVYPDASHMLSTTVSANFFNNTYGTMQGLHLPQDERSRETDDKIEDANAMNRDTIRKKKRKKKKKSKPGDNGAESTTEGEEVKPSSTKVGEPPSSSSDGNSTRKISAESSSEKENLSGESDSKIQQTPDKRTDMKERMKDKNTMAKESGFCKKKKGEQRKKKENDGGTAQSLGKTVNQKVDDVHDDGIRLEDKQEVQKVNEHDNVGSKNDSSLFALRRRAADDASGFHSNSELAKENDHRAAMSDPGENDDGDGEFNVVTNRRSRRRLKEAGHFGHQGYASRNFLWYDSASQRNDRYQDAPWYIRKSSSLPKEMCNFSSARKRMGTSEAEEPVSTTTTTTASSRRDSLESDENIDQKRFSYASKLKGNIQGNSSVQSGPEVSKDVAGNKEVLETASSQSNSKPKTYSISKNKKDSHLDMLVHPTTGSKQVNGNPPSSSITSAMNLEVGLGNSSHKFDLNFPNLTGNSNSVSKGGMNSRHEERESMSVQYLDLECTNNTYAARVKQSLGNSNKMALHTASEASRNDDSLRTTQCVPETVASQTGKTPTVEEKPVPVVAHQEKDVCSINHVKPIAVDRETGASDVFEGGVEDGSNAGCTASQLSLQSESSTEVMGNDLQGSTVGRPCPSSNQLPPQENGNGSNPIWFGSLLVSDNQIFIMNDSDHQQDDFSQDRERIPANSSSVTRHEGKDVTPDDAKMLSPMDSGNKGEMGKVEETVSVELMSGLIVKIVTGDPGANTGRSNHNRIKEMLSKDWEKTVQQGQDFPEMVQHIMD